MNMSLTCKCGIEAHYIWTIDKGCGFRCEGCKTWYGEIEVARAQEKYNKYTDKHFKDLFKDLKPFMKPTKNLIDFIER